MQVDRSGFTVSYTSELRNSTLGVLTLGTYDINVPPGVERYAVRGFCRIIPVVTHGLNLGNAGAIGPIEKAP